MVDVATAVEVEVWSDVVCPWCLVGQRRLATALSRFEHADAVDVRYRSFELDPSAVSATTRADGPSDAHARRLAAKLGRSGDDGLREVQQMVAHVDALAAAEGLELHQDVSVPANTAKAHQLLHLARERGVQAALHARLLHAHFSEGEPLGDDDTLVRLAAEVGLDGAEARAVLDGDTHLAAVRADEAEAVRLGARGVPFLVVDRRYGLSGARPVEHLLEVLRRAWSERDAEVVSPR